MGLQRNDFSNEQSFLIVNEIDCEHLKWHGHFDKLPAVFFACYGFAVESIHYFQLTGNYRVITLIITKYSTTAKIWCFSVRNVNVLLSFVFEMLKQNKPHV